MTVKRIPAIDRVIPKLRAEGECWVFTGWKDSKGYGYVARGGKYGGTIAAYRVTYDYFRAEIPDGLSLDHLCRNRACCNPWHLEPVTHQVNLQRSGPATKTHCVRGHLRNGRGGCSECVELRMREAIARRSELRRIAREERKAAKQPA